ncbi:hypothetical protein PsYK624_150880, partial [Phanerochaete sordida]
MVTFLSQLLNLDRSLVPECWNIFKDLVWCDEYVQDLLQNPENGFRSFGIALGLAARTLYPPSMYCTKPDCPRNIEHLPLKQEHQQATVVFTHAEGTLPAYHVHLKCDKCKRDYHHNYYVEEGKRHYYDEVPEMFEVGEHQFVDRRLVLHWMSSMGHSWTSAYGCVQTYEDLNSTAPVSPPFPEWQFSSALRIEHVWDAFTLLSLLEDSKKRSSPLCVPHGGQHKDRFLDAVRQRNLRIRLTGQPEMHHRCKKCVRYYEGGPGGMRSVSCVVVDGVTIGHPCCAIHNCQEPLANQRHRYCQSHSAQNSICAIQGCEEPIGAPNTLVCNNAVHRKIWTRHKERGQARFTLAARLRNARLMTAPADADEVSLEQLSDLATE